VVADGAVGEAVAAGEQAPTIRTTTAANTAIVDGFFLIDSSSNRSVGSGR